MRFSLKGLLPTLHILWYSDSLMSETLEIVTLRVIFWSSASQALQAWTPVAHVLRANRRRSAGETWMHTFLSDCRIGDVVLPTFASSWTCAQQIGYVEARNKIQGFKVLVWMQMRGRH